MTRWRVREGVIKNPHVAASSSGTKLVHGRCDVIGATDVTEVFPDAPVDAHSSVISPENHQHLVEATPDCKEFRVADGSHVSFLRLI